MRTVTSTELRDHLLRGKPFAFDPCRGTDLSQGVPRPFKAAELGLEPFRYCPLCGRRMVTQVLPNGWTARCSRHGEVSSYLFEH